MSLKEKGYIGDDFWGQAKRLVTNSKSMCQGRHDVGSHYLVRSLERSSKAQFYTTPIELKTLCTACGRVWWAEQPREAE